MENDSTKIIKAILTFFVVASFLKFLATDSMFKSKEQKGHGYSFVAPLGWKKVKDPKGVSPIFEVADKPEINMFIAPENMPNTEIPAAFMAVLTAKLANPTWLEDDFPTLVEALVRAGYRVIDRGQIKIDENIFRWIFYEDMENSMLSMEFYLVNDINRLYKIQFTTDSKGFKKYRPVFEASKDTLKLSNQIW